MNYLQFERIKSPSIFDPFSKILLVLIYYLNNVSFRQVIDLKKEPLFKRTLYNSAYLNKSAVILLHSILVYIRWVLSIYIAVCARSSNSFKKVENMLIAVSGFWPDMKHDYQIYQNYSEKQINKLEWLMSSPWNIGNNKHREIWICGWRRWLNKRSFYNGSNGTVFSYYQNTVADWTKYLLYLPWLVLLDKRCNGTTSSFHRNTEAD